MNTCINAYLNFNGNCREAMIFYQLCLGGDLTLQKVSESPMAAQISSKESAQILHSVLRADRMVIMGSGMMGTGLIKGNAVSLCINCTSDEEIATYFSKLSDGGQVRTPLHQTFWGATYGELTDRFGIDWMFNYSKDQ